MTVLDPAELQSPPLPTVDDCGRVFVYGDLVLRGIRPHYLPTINSLLESPLLVELISKGWIPPTTISSFRISGFPLVLEQPRIHPLSYAFEWTFDMLRDAALLVLTINDLALSHGWELKDAHHYNILFSHLNPCWVDIGSFTPRTPTSTGWIAEYEFLRSYIAPLRIWSDGAPFLARAALASSEMVPPQDIAVYRWPVFRSRAIAVYNAIHRLRRGYRFLGHRSDNYLSGRLSPFLFRLARRLKANMWLPGRHFRSQEYRRQLQRIRRPNARTPWQDYQSAGEQFVRTDRFNRIADIIKRLGPSSITELGSNQGRFSERLISEGIISSSICVDSDENALNFGYTRTRSLDVPLSFARVDLVRPLQNAFTTAPTSRLVSDAVLALALSHHLLLSQQMSLDAVVRAISSYARRYVLLEFMPLGLWDGIHPTPPIPTWYTIDAFRRVFSDYVIDSNEEVLAPNRVLFWGRKRSTSNN